jgi:hypothetical protein
MTYLLDANAFMEAARLYYGFDLVPGFWRWLKDSSIERKVASVRTVRDEIVQGEGDLVEWAKQLPRDFWLDDSPESLQNMARLVDWAEGSSQHYVEAAVAEFADSADLRLIAAAMTHGAIVATREKSQPEAQKKIKIPDVCRAFGVSCVVPFDAYRQLGMCLS